MRPRTRISLWLPRHWNEAGRSESTAYGTDAPKIPPFRGGESVVRITLGWVFDRSFTPIPGSSVGNTSTLRGCYGKRFF